MKSVDVYTALDLGENSDAVRSLTASATDEAALGTIVVSGATQSHNARLPAALTPNMQAWYARHIAGPRVAAIADIRNAFQADTADEGSAKGVYREAERDAALRKTVQAGIGQATRFADTHRRVLDEHERNQTKFATLRATLNREPTRVARWIYVALLIAIILLEAAINFESFLRVPYITSPFLATGATLAVGLAIGFAAHFHGIVLRQAHFLFSPQEANEAGYEGRRRDAIKRLAFGGVLLAIALLMVGGARYYYLRDYITQAAIIGRSPPSMFGGIIFMLLGNVIAYLVGVLIAYSTHDPHPLYAERDRELRASTKTIEELKKQRTAALRTLRDGADTEIKGQENQDATSRSPRYADLRDAADRIVNKDQEVVGALLGYRTTLLASLGGRADRAMFRYPDGAYATLLPATADLFLTGDQYAAMPLSLGFTTGEN